MSLKTKIGLALATTAVGATLAGAGTFALFTSSATNDGNTFTAGTVSIQDIGSNIASSMVNYGNLAPGDTGSATLHVKNNGSLDEWVKVNTDATTGTTTSGDLFTGDHPLTLSYTGPVRIPAGETRDITVSYNFPGEAGNSYQGKTGSAKIVLQGVQARNNENAGATAPNNWQ